MARTKLTVRLAEPEDIARVIVFLATDDARRLTGQVVHVNGGEHHGGRNGDPGWPARGR